MTKRFAKAAILHPEAQEVDNYYTKDGIGS